LTHCSIHVWLQTNRHRPRSFASLSHFTHTMSPLSVKKAYIDINNSQQLHYRHVVPQDNSSGVIIFLHKSASSSSSWEKLMLHYASQGFSCYAPDMPGFGASFDPTPEQEAEIERTGTEWFATVFVTALERLGTTKTAFHIIGHHSGASLATQIAADHPDLVRSICQIGATTIGYEERQRMRDIYLVAFNQPTSDGTHLQKTWDYLGKMGIGDDLRLRQREALDHIRAWKGRMLIYGAVWNQDAETLFLQVSCPILVLCAKDDVLWEHMENVKRLRADAKTGVVSGANFSPELDVEGIVREWDAFQSA
jgi:pimeloyl-ACP methyl ester carboxylesterase